MEKRCGGAREVIRLARMKGVTNSISIVKPSADTGWCDPKQHSRDEHAFVQMMVLCAVAWLTWRLYRRVRRRNEIPRMPRRRTPGAFGE